MERRVLGRGLEALISQIPKTTSLDKELTRIEINKIKTNPYQPRKEFSKPMLEELVASIKEKGIIQPIIVRKIAQDDYELVAGERRLRAAKMLDMETIPAIIKEVNDEDSLALSLIENIQREALNPIEEAQAYQKLIDDFKLTQEEIAKIVGKARATIANILRLLKLPQEIQDELQKGTLSFAHGRTLLELEDPDLQISVFRSVVANSLSVKELENIICQKMHKKTKNKLQAISVDPYKKDLENRLSQALGTKVTVVHKNKKGKIEIEYYSLADLERITNRFLTKEISNN